MPQSRKQQLFLDAIEFSFSMVAIAYQRVVSYCKSPTDLPDPKLDEAMVLDAWSCIDAIKRLRSVLERTPGLRASASLKLFMQATADIPSFRHYVQHIDEKPGLVASSGRPIWGSFSWARVIPDHKSFEITCYAPGRLAKAEGIPLVNPTGREFHDLVDHFEVTVGSDTINLSETVRQVERLHQKYKAALAAAAHKVDKQGDSILHINLDL